jgi:hypothetical protein
MDSCPLDPDQPSAARRRTATNADSPERSQDPPSSERKRLIFALEDLHKMAILDHDEFAAEMKRVTDPQPTPDPVSPKPHHRRWPRMRLLTGGFQAQSAGGLSRTMAIRRKLVSWKSAGTS